MLMGSWIGTVITNLTGNADCIAAFTNGKLTNIYGMVDRDHHHKLAW